MRARGGQGVDNMDTARNSKLQKWKEKLETWKEVGTEDGKGRGGKTIKEMGEDREIKDLSAM